MEKRKEIIVAGCGPAGMMAAIAAARGGAGVTILEGMEKPGKKLLLTGSGKCNLSNLDPGLQRRYQGEDPELARRFALKVLEQLSVSDTVAFFADLGLLTTDKGGYLYPYSGQSSSVLEVLLSEIRRWKIKVKYKEKITEILWRDGWWDVNTATWTYRCDHLILACGSKALPETGSDGSGYELARSIGHRIAPVSPALAGLCSRGTIFQACAGVRCHTKVTVCALERVTENAIGYKSEKEKDNAIGQKQGSGRESESRWITMASDTGELQWTENGISGIVVFQVSRFVSDALRREERVRAILDFLPEMPELELFQYLKKQTHQYENSTVFQALSGILPSKLLLALLNQAQIKPGTNAGVITDTQKTNLVHIIKTFTIPITATRQFDQCQACAGGVDLKEIDPETMNSKICPGLSFAGEVVDIDGPCGGYNLQWAWSSGYVAGSHAAENSLVPSR